MSEGEKAADVGRHIHQLDPCVDVGDREAPASPSKIRIDNSEIMAMLDTSVLCDPRSSLPQFANFLTSMAPSLS